MHSKKFVQASVFRTVTTKKGLSTVRRLFVGRTLNRPYILACAVAISLGAVAAFGLSRVDVVPAAANAANHCTIYAPIAWYAVDNQWGCSDLHSIGTAVFHTNGYALRDSNVASSGESNEKIVWYEDRDHTYSFNANDSVGYSVVTNPAGSGTTYAWAYCHHYYSSSAGLCTTFWHDG